MPPRIERRTKFKDIGIVSLTRATIIQFCGLSVKSFLNQTTHPQEIQAKPARVQRRHTMRLCLDGQSDMRSEQRKRIALGTPET